MKYTWQMRRIKTCNDYVSRVRVLGFAPKFGSRYIVQLTYTKFKIIPCGHTFTHIF